MADPPIDIRIVTGQQFRDLSKKLKGDLSKDLRVELNKQIRAATAPVVEDLKNAVLSVDSQVTGRSSAGSGEAARALHAGSGRINRKRGHGLRATIARSIQTKITTSGSRAGVRIRIDTTKLPADQRSLPKHLDSPKGWRHPVFGNKNAWVTQKGQPWWSSTIAKHTDEVRAKILAAMKSISERI